MAVLVNILFHMKSSQKCSTVHFLHLALQVLSKSWNNSKIERYLMGRDLSDSWTVSLAEIISNANWRDVIDGIQHFIFLLLSWSLTPSSLTSWMLCMVWGHKQNTCPESPVTVWWTGSVSPQLVWWELCLRLTSARLRVTQDTLLVLVLQHIRDFLPPTMDPHQYV